MTYITTRKIPNDFRCLVIVFVSPLLYVPQSKLESKISLILSKTFWGLQKLININIMHYYMVPAPVSDQRQLKLTFCSLPLLGQRNKGENKG
jgi:hypothetical protein